MAVRAWLAGLVALWPGLGAAQDWVTPELCTVPETPVIHPEVFEPLSLQDARAAAATIENGTGKFWRIETADGQVSHLWGTMHTSDRAVLDLPDAVLAQIDAARTIALEIDPRAKSREEYTAFVNDQSIWRSYPVPLDMLGMDADVSEAILDRLDATGWGRDSAEYLTLGTLAELLLSSPCEDFTMGVLPIQDSFIQTLGHINGARIVGLEDTNRLRAYFDNPANRDTAIAMIEVYGSFFEQDDNFQIAGETAVALYLSGEMALWSVWEGVALAESLGNNRGPEVLGLMDDYLVVQRNYDFNDALRQLLAEGGVFIAVGAGHIAGAEGMVELMRADGHTVTRIPLPGEAP